MKIHEVHCTANPNRDCRMCRRLELSQQPIERLKAVFESEGLRGLREATGNCPVCILAALRQSGAFRYDPDPTDGSTLPPPDFDFKKELTAANIKANEIQAEWEAGTRVVVE